MDGLVITNRGNVSGSAGKFKGHFVYDLLYHILASQKEMIKEGKTWGWNLEKPNHVRLFNVELSNSLMTFMDWMNDMIEDKRKICMKR